MAGSRLDPYTQILGGKYMLKRIKRSVVLLATTALLAAAFAPIGFLGQAEASSSNTISEVQYVGKSEQLAADYPVVILKNNAPNWASQSQVVRLTLDNGAKWDATGVLTAAAVSGAAIALADAVNPGDIGSSNATGAAVAVTRLNNSTIEVTFRSATGWAKDDELYIPILATVGSTAGEYKVTVSNWGGNLSGGVYTYAIVAGGGTVATVADALQVSRLSNNTGAAITIDETHIGSLSNGANTFKLRLPNGFTWNDTNTTIVGTNGVTVAKGALSNGSRDMQFSIDPTAKINANIRSSAIITPVFNVKRDAKKGDVLVQLIKVAGDVSAQSDLKIAIYKDFGMTVEADDITDYIAGSFEWGTGTETITIKETAPGSFIAGRPFDLELPVGLNFTTPEAITFTDANSPGVFEEQLAREDGAASNKLQIDWQPGTVPGDLLDDDGLRYFEIELSFVASADYCSITTGDKKEVKLKVSHAGVDSVEEHIANVYPPFTVSTTVTDVKLGVQKQPVADITIKETFAGTLIRANNVNTTLRIEGPAIGAFWIAEVGSIEVTDGDLVLDVDASGRANENRAIDVVVKAESSKASTIVIKGVTITTDRTVPEMKFAYRFGDGDVTDPAVNDVYGMVDNNAKQIYTSFARFNGSVDYVNMITPAERDIMTSAQFTIGSATYKMLVDGKWVDKTMDAAAYILNGRTMVPLRFAGEALGATVRWEDESSSAILMQGTLVVRVQPGSRTMLVNGTPIMMDVPAVNKGGRIYLPISQVGLAMNATSSWDAATQTATFTVFPR
jgi:hypothetical protein